MSASNMNYFELFQLPVEFKIDTAQLARQYRKLQQKYHPDSVQQHVTEDQTEMLRLSTLVNTGYQTLLQDDARASHILEINKQAFQLDASIDDINFLQNALELREQLDQVQFPVEVDSLRLEVQQWLLALGREFELDLNDEDWGEARDTVRKMRFMQKVAGDIESTADRLDDLDDLDQDLF